MRVNDISRKWEKWFHRRVILIAYILCNDQWNLLIFGTQVKMTIIFCSTIKIVRFFIFTFWAIWCQNFDNFILGHTVDHQWYLQHIQWHLRLHLSPLMNNVRIQKDRHKYSVTMWCLLLRQFLWHAAVYTCMQQETNGHHRAPLCTCKFSWNSQLNTPVPVGS